MVALRHLGFLKPGISLMCHLRLFIICHHTKCKKNDQFNTKIMYPNQIQNGGRRHLEFIYYGCFKPDTTLFQLMISTSVSIHDWLLLLRAEQKVPLCLCCPARIQQRTREVWHCETPSYVLPSLVSHGLFSRLQAVWIVSVPYNVYSSAALQLRLYPRNKDCHCIRQT